MSEQEEGKILAADIHPDELSDEALAQFKAIYKTMREKPGSVSIPKDSPLGLYLAENAEKPSEEEIELVWGRKSDEIENMIFLYDQLEADLLDMLNDVRGRRKALKERSSYTELQEETPDEDG